MPPVPPVPPVPLDVATLAVRAAALGNGRRALLGLAGAPGSGKSSLAAALAASLPRAVVVPMDGFHLPTARLRELGRVERRGAPDTFDAAGFVRLLARLREGADVRAPGFDRAAEEPAPAAIAVPGAASPVIVEGNYLLLDRPPWSAARGLLDEVWFLEVPEQVRVERLVARFVSFGMPESQARERVVRGSDARNAEAVAATRARADLIIGAGS